MMLPRMHDSPMPMKTMSGLDSETATAPTDELVICPSVTGAQLLPASVVFHNPPPTAPKYASRGRPFTPATAIERPPRSGPMLRHRYASSKTGSIDCDCAEMSWVIAGRCPAIMATISTASMSAVRKRPFIRASEESASVLHCLSHPLPRSEANDSTSPLPRRSLGVAGGKPAIGKRHSPCSKEPCEEDEHVDVAIRIVRAQLHRCSDARVL